MLQQRRNKPDFLQHYRRNRYNAAIFSANVYIFTLSYSAINCI